MALRSDQGAALVATVWVVLLLSILAVGVMQVIRDNRFLPSAIEKQLMDQHLAESAIELYLQRHLRDLGNNTVLTNSINVLGQEVTVTVELEDAKIDINQADHPLLSAMIAFFGSAQAEAYSIAYAIMDWRDQDSLVTATGAEAEAYRTDDMPYEPRNGPFETVGELRLVRGMTEELFACLAPIVTVYANPSLGDALNKGVALEYSPAKVLSVFDWAFANNWYEDYWPDPNGLVADPENLELAKRAVTFRVSTLSQPGRVYTKTLRIQNFVREEMRYSTVRGLRSEAAVGPACDRTKTQ